MDFTLDLTAFGRGMHIFFVVYNSNIPIVKMYMKGSWSTANKNVMFDLDVNSFNVWWELCEISNVIVILPGSIFYRTFKHKILMQKHEVFYLKFCVIINRYVSFQWIFVYKCSTLCATINISSLKFSLVGKKGYFSLQVNKHCVWENKL